MHILSILHAQIALHTGFLKLTPHHNTGARFVAQSNVNKLMNQIIPRTGIGARRTSVRLRNGRAVVESQRV